MLCNKVSNYNLYTVILGLFIIRIKVSVCGSKQTDKIDKMIEASNKRKPVDPLSCHVCHSEIHSECYNFTEAGETAGEDFVGFPQQCEPNSTYCMVRRFSFTLTDENGTWPMKTFGVKRNCSSKCEPGCVIMGERTRLYVCNSCCQTRLCNTGSGSDGFVRKKYSSLIQKLVASLTLIIYFSILTV